MMLFKALREMSKNENPNLPKQASVSLWLFVWASCTWNSTSSHLCTDAEQSRQNILVGMFSAQFLSGPPAGVFAVRTRWPSNQNKVPPHVLPCNHSPKHCLSKWANMIWIYVTLRITSLPYCTAICNMQFFWTTLFKSSFSFFSCR